MKQLIEKVEEEWAVRVKVRLGLAPLTDEGTELAALYNPTASDEDLLSMEENSIIRISVTNKKTQETKNFVQDSESFMQAFDKQEIKTFLTSLITK